MRTLTNKQFYAIGKRLMARDPKLAHKLLSTWESEVILPKETDLSKIEFFFSNFCLLQDIEPEEYRGAIVNRAKSAIRKMFVACMLQIYWPMIFKPQAQFLIRTRGIVRALSRELQVKEANISKMIKEVVQWHQLYDDFRGKVNELTEKILQINEQAVIT
jgi:hypothetical protein